MAEEFDIILDKCIDRINRGEKIEDCLADYPEYSRELEPLLKSMLITKNAYSFEPRAFAKERSWQQFSAALRESDRRQEKSWLTFPWIFGKARAWAVVTAAMVIALVSYFVITQLTPPGVIVPETNPEGNFAFLISDAPNAIDDFESLNLTISKIGLHQKGGKWVEFTPETSQVDLALLQGDLAQQVWRGDVPKGQYDEAVLYVTGTSGVLKNSGETVNIKLSSNKLRLVMPFEISGDSVTEFVYDVTVIATGGGRYNLKPVAEQSGTDKQIEQVNSQGQSPGQGQGQDQDQGQGQGQG